MNQLGTVYATKRRRRNSKSLKPPPKDGVTKSNPSKRHRERLNAELDTLASLLPFDASILSKLDKLSILRLSVSYLRTKSYFQVAMQGCKEVHGRADRQRNHDYSCAVDNMLDSDLILEALNGFLLILACEGEVFFASHTIENYLGFHQSDIVHQSVYELVHSEDREELQRQLTWNAFLPTDVANTSLHDVLQSDSCCHYLERSFTVRFRCLLDNTSGFLRLDIRGRIKVLHGQNRKSDEPPMALFAVCTPFGPPSLLEMPQKDMMFKSKHKLDMSLVSMDQRGKILLGYTDAELANKGGYDLVHFDDLAYVASAHQELLKTGASGMIAYRMVTKENQWQWLQTSSRLVYKCSKPDFVICTHRPLIDLAIITNDYLTPAYNRDRLQIDTREEEGRDLLGKRTMDFKVSYLDTALGSNNYVPDNEYVLRSQRNRRYKNQLRDILTTCRKRKLGAGTEYIEDPSYNNAVYAYPTDNGISPYTVQPNLQNLYPNLDNSRFLSAEDFLQYRHLSGYYTDYAPHPSQYNGFLDMSSRTCIPSYATTEPGPGAQMPKEEKLYPCQLDTTKYNGQHHHQLLTKPLCCDNYVDTSPLRGCIVTGPTASQLQPLGSSSSSSSSSPLDRDSLKNSNDGVMGCGTRSSSALLTVKSGKGASAGKEDKSQSLGGSSQPVYTTNDTRQTVLMWGSTNVATSCRAQSSLKYMGSDHHSSASCKWALSSPTPKNSLTSLVPRSAANCYPYSAEVPAELEANGDAILNSQLADDRTLMHCPVEKHHDGNPLLTISEVTNTLLSHD